MDMINKRNKKSATLYLRLILLLLFPLPCSLLAQNGFSIQIVESGTDSTFSQRMTNYIMPLDKSHITTGFLADKAYPNVSLTSFDGQTDSVITLSQWKQVHRQMYLAAVSDSNTIISPEELKQRTRNLSSSGIIPIALMNLKYNRFKSYAIDSNLVMLSNGKLYDVAGRTESPYLEERLFAATVYQDKVYNGRVTFKIDDHLFLCNCTDTVSMVEIDFGDERGYRNYSLTNLLNNSISINYLQTGAKTITIRMTLSDQTVLQTKTRIILVQEPMVEPDEVLEITGKEEFNGIKGTGKAYVLYGCGNQGKIRKPIIVSDGFDPGNKQGFYELFDMLNKEQFLEKALSEGYDFIILDYTDGTDYIQRNAFVMVSLIDEVNARMRRNGHFSKLTIIGPSMGGLITRYALNYMEQTNQEHNTGLYVSFDSPHFGANIPLGDQYWIDFFTSTTEAENAIESREILNTKAAKQMLIYHYSTNTDTVHPLRANLLADTYYNSWPTQCRKIAIANGSGIGTTLFAPQTQIITWNWSLWVKGNVWALPTQSNVYKQIFEGRMTFFDYGFFYLSFAIISKDVFVKDHKPYDGAPGGMKNVNDLIANSDTGGHGDIQTDYPNICFIPIISSLALNTNDVNYRVHDIQDYPYPSNNITPFDAIYAPIENQEHVEVTQENIDWIMNEIGAMDLYIQNQTVNKPTDFEARNTITTGKDIVSYLPEGDFVVQNDSGEVILRSERTIRLMDGTYLMPCGTGRVSLYTSQFLCPSWTTLPENPLNRGSDNGKTKDPEQVLAEIHEETTLPAEKLPRTYPNPCNDNTTIEYELEENAKVGIELYNLMGIKLMTVVNFQDMGAGRYLTKINTTSLPAGIYIAVIRANSEIIGIVKIQVMK